MPVYISKRHEGFALVGFNVLWSQVPVLNGSSLRAVATNMPHTPKTDSAGLQSGNVAAESSMLVPLAQKWRQIQEESNWKGLDDILRAEIIRYGEFAQACYDNFDFDEHSKYCGLMSSFWSLQAFLLYSNSLLKTVCAMIFPAMSL